MFKRFSNRDMAGLVEEINAFVTSSYQELPQSPSDTSSQTADSQTDETDHASSIDAGPYVMPGDLQYQRKDNYNSHSIDRAVLSLSSAEDVSGTTRIIEDNTNMSFVDKMLDYIKVKQMRDSEVYKAAHVDRRLFSKIVSDHSYKPAKDTCIALSLALKLSISEANDILARAGYVLSHSSKRDVIIEYFFRNGICDLNEVNKILFILGQKQIGR